VTIGDQTFYFGQTLLGYGHPKPRGAEGIIHCGSPGGSFYAERRIDYPKLSEEQLIIRQNLK